MVAQLAGEVGLMVRDVPPDEVQLVLGPDEILVFRNLPDTDDCVIGFDGSGWHCHGELQCSDKHGYNVELSYLDIITGLGTGSVLVCERVVAGQLQERWLVHRDYVDEFRYMDAGEEVRVRRIEIGAARAPDTAAR